jgi:PPOX class probable F420-dependent enzyme
MRPLTNIAANPRVAVVADHYEDDWHALWWVRADGTGRLLATEEPEGRYAIMQLLERYRQYRDQPPRRPVVAIDVTRWPSWSASGD